MSSFLVGRCDVGAGLWVRNRLQGLQGSYDDQSVSTEVTSENKEYENHVQQFNKISLDSHILIDTSGVGPKTQSYDQFIISHRLAVDIIPFLHRIIMNDHNISRKTSNDQETTDVTISRHYHDLMSPQPQRITRSALKTIETSTCLPVVPYHSTMDLLQLPQSLGVPLIEYYLTFRRFHHHE
jgi:hypothetical protein